jgi:hypothetical protein
MKRTTLAACILIVAQTGASEAGYRLICGAADCCIQNTSTKICVKVGKKADLEKELKRIRFCLKVEGHETEQTEHGPRDICTGEYLEKRK